MYLDQKMTIGAIARQLNYNADTVSQWMNKYGIPKRSHSEEIGGRLHPDRKKLTLAKDELTQLYITKKLSLSEIGRRYNVSHDTVKARLQELGIATRSTTSKVTTYPLADLYNGRGWSIQQIADYVGLSQEAVRKQMKKQGIERRGVGHTKGVEFTDEHKANMKATNAMRGKFGPAHPGWKGGRYTDQDGYSLIRVDGKTVRENRYIYEQTTGQKLTSDTDVHHKDLVRGNNDPSNLEAIGHGDHTAHHWENEKRAKMVAAWTPERKIKMSKRFSKPIPGLTEDVLRELYAGQGLTLRAIAEQFGSNRETIRQKLKSWNITR
jgi:DNA-binding CsgD family transcriptional regulator